MKRIAIAAFMACALLASAAGARAGILYNYDWGSSTTQVVSDNGIYGLKVTPEPKTLNQTFSRDTPAADLTLFVMPGKIAGPDSFTNKTINLNLILEDVGPPLATGSVLLFKADFSMTVPGTGAEGGSVTSLTLTPETHLQTVGGLDFDVGISPFTGQWFGAPTGIGQFVKGGIFLYVDVKEHQDPPNETPEPSSMILAGLGLSSLGLAGWRKLRRRKE